ncbi:MAG: hypothetical protein HC940_00935 [Acaryochloris sp. SU_5_25]|nr:hypothetical protein [Acaryochloris sp. SU_5_25]
MTIERSYVSGSLTLEAAEDIQVIVPPQQFATISLQAHQEKAIAILESANPAELIRSLGEAIATGSLIVRTVYVQP